MVPLLYCRHPISLLRSIRPWQAGQWRYFCQQLHRYGPVPSEYTDDQHLRAAATWLCVAQDASDVGGIPGRYVLGVGWSRDYPKTTGDLIPTFLKLADRFGDDQFLRRAETCVRFLLPLQMESGAFLGGEVGDKVARPSVFNSAQIMSGLVAWYQATGDMESLECAIRTADWLISVQDSDGAWRQFFFNNITSTHSSYLACWLAELGRFLGIPIYLESACRNLTWVLSHQQSETAWIDLAGHDRALQERRAATTHSIAYTLMGALQTARVLGDVAAISCVRQAAMHLALFLLKENWLPAVFNWQWRPQASFACLSGNAQMAALWLTFHHMTPDLQFLQAARHALNIVKKTQSLDNPNKAIRGGILGSNPVWGEYIFLGLPNWAAKFFVDAMLLYEI